jgi:integrase/recombinase XerD
MQTTDPFAAQVATFVEAMRVRSYSPSTINSYRDSLRLFSRFLEGERIASLLDVTSATLRRYQIWLQQQDYSGWTILVRLQAVRRLFQHLETAQLILLNPCSALEPARLPRRLPKTVLTAEEAKRLLEVPNLGSRVGIRDRAILEVFYSCGIRLAEMTRLTVVDVDCRGGFLRVNQGKGGQDRVVPMGQNASQWVRRYLDEVRRRWSTAAQDVKALWLSSRQPHEALKSQAIEVMVRHYGRRSGLGRQVTPHVWRHTCATHLVASGANIAYVQRLLGHRSLRTTQIYVCTSIAEIQATHAQAHPRNQATVP